MASFEIYDGQVIYTNGDIGAILEPNTGNWLPFSFFHSGNMDISDKYKLGNPIDALKIAAEIYT